MKRLLFTAVMIILLSFNAYGQQTTVEIQTEKDRATHCFCSCHTLNSSNGFISKDDSLSVKDITGVIAVGGGSNGSSLAIGNGTSLVSYFTFPDKDSTSAIKTTETEQEESGETLIYSSSGWVHTTFSDSKNLIQGTHTWKPMWSGIELTKDGYAITDDKDYTYIEVPNTEISSYYDKHTKQMKITICCVTYVYLWNEDKQDFDFISVME